MCSDETNLEEGNQQAVNDATRQTGLGDADFLISAASLTLCLKFYTWVGMQVSIAGSCHYDTGTGNFALRAGYGEPETVGSRT